MKEIKVEKKVYSVPVLNIEKFDSDDIITTSGGNSDPMAVFPWGTTTGLGGE